MPTISLVTFDGLRTAIRGGHLAVLKWLREVWIPSSPTIENHSDVDEYCLTKAIEYHQIEVAKLVAPHVPHQRLLYMYLQNDKGWRVLNEIINPTQAINVHWMRTFSLHWSVEKLQHVHQPSTQLPSSFECSAF
ncbi:Aste57867_19880 [Aphanomyces stellatus]|uniref:Aste57867_19880 protein n=1 Tax=Aphanomyces stellatus TaxID=120398 RepID=A0A485LDP5_9STRA|nr:hypothetical protein As57867_019814 [Aphanomyces stellatus]VFT96578.1 Aste57867_19880 [Aphanomyces stellatus]